MSAQPVPPIEILLVDDTSSDVELTLHALRAGGLTNEIHVARDGAAALDLLLSDDPDAPRHLPRLILLDLKLPKVSGMEVLKRLKSDPRTSTIPVVVLTSSKEAPDLEACYALGANSYIVKPVDFAEFSEVVRSIGFYWMLLNTHPHGPA